MPSDSDKILATMGSCTLIIVGVILLVPLSWLIQGFVLSRLWEWFVTPVFENVPALGIWQAAGISAVIGFLTYPTELHQVVKDPEKEKWQSFVYILFFRPLLTFVTGYLIYRFFIS